MFLNFNRKHGFFLAAFAACTLNLYGALIDPIFLAPGQSWSGILVVQQDEWVGVGSAAGTSPTWEDSVGWEIPQLFSPDIVFSSPQQLLFSTLGTSSIAQLRAMVVPRIAAQYEFTAYNYGYLSATFLPSANVITNPEPSTLLLIGSGFITLGLLRRKLKLQK